MANHPFEIEQSDREAIATRLERGRVGDQMINDHLLSLALVPFQLPDQTLSLEVRVTFEHRQALVAADGRNFHHVQRPKFEQPADGFMPEIVKVQVLNAEPDDHEPPG